MEDQDEVSACNNRYLFHSCVVKPSVLIYSLDIALAVVRSIVDLPQFVLVVDDLQHLEDRCVHLHNALNRLQPLLSRPVP